MKKYLVIYKPFLLFLAKFFLSYLVLISLYQLYLNQFDTAQNEVDGFTQIVAQQTESILRFMNYNVTIKPHLFEPSIRIYIDQKAIVRVVEGCNALSVMILFVSFIIAFTGKFWQMFLYIFSGLLLIHVLNVLRIALLVVGLLEYKEFEILLHDIFFPLVIYGVVFGLWVIWVNKFSNHANNS